MTRLKRLNVLILAVVISCTGVTFWETKAKAEVAYIINDTFDTGNNNWKPGGTNDGFSAAVEAKNGALSVSFPEGNSSANGNASCIVRNLETPVDLTKGLVAVEADIRVPQKSYKKIDFKYNRPDDISDLPYSTEARGLYKLFGISANSVIVVKGVADDKISTKTSGSWNGTYFKHNNNELLKIKIIFDNANARFYYTMTDGSGNNHKGWDDERMYRPVKTGENGNETLSYSDDLNGDGVADVLNSFSIVSYGESTDISLEAVRVYYVNSLTAEMKEYRSDEPITIKFESENFGNSDLSECAKLYDPSGNVIQTQNSFSDGVLKLSPTATLDLPGDYRVKLDKTAIEDMGFRYTSPEEFEFSVMYAENAAFYFDGTDGFGGVTVYNKSGMMRNISAIVSEKDATGKLLSCRIYSKDIDDNSSYEYQFDQQIKNEENEFNLYIWQSDNILPVTNKMTVGKMTRLYVAPEPDGNDDNSGTKEAPFATLERARDEIRKTKDEIGDRGVTVYFRAGEYFFDTHVRIDEVDSGKANAPVVYRAYPGEEVIFTGGYRLDENSFSKAEITDTLIDEEIKDKLVMIEIPEVIGLDNEFWRGEYSYYPVMKEITGVTGTLPTELFINDKAMTVARYPNEGYLYTGTVWETGAKPGNWSITDTSKADYVAPEDRIPAPFTVNVSDERVQRWVNAENALLYGKWSEDWLDQTVPLASVDINENTITSKYPVYYGAEENRPFYVYNLLEELDSPGEYYIDRETRILYLYPPEEFKDVYISMHKSSGFLSMYYASNVQIKDITMKCGRYRAVTISGGENNLVENCEIYNFAGPAVYIGGGTNNGVKNCIIHDNNSGVYLSGGDRQTLTFGKNYVTDCDIYSNDRLSKTYSPGVEVYGVGNIVSHNKIHDAEHDLLEFSGNEHIIEYNEIYNGVNDSDDAGAVYTWGSATYRGNKIRYNYFHDIGNGESGRIGRNAVFLDGFMSAAHIYGNVFHKIGGAPVKLAGSDNIVENNIIVDCPAAPGAADIRVTFYPEVHGTQTLLESLEAVPYQGEIWSKEYPELLNYINSDGSLTTGSNIVFKNNILCNTKKILVSSSIRERGTFENNVIFEDDPGFTDYDNGDFSLKDNAEAFNKLPEFKNIPFKEIGIR